jgi:hypothetical protein
MDILPMDYCLMAWPASYRLRLPRQSGSDGGGLIGGPRFLISIAPPAR